MLASAGFRLFANPWAARTAPYGKDGREAILSLAAFGDAKREIMSWPGYKPTPLRSLPKLAARAGVGAILYKDEAERFGIGSFKALGGAYAVFKLLRKTIWEQKNIVASTLDLTSGRYADLTSHTTVTCATDGNHGRSVAWGAHTFGCRCVIYIPETVSEGRCQAIAAYGAEVKRVAGTYNDGVRRVAADAAVQGWTVVSDTSYEGYTDVPRDVMQGCPGRRWRLGGRRMFVSLGATWHAAPLFRGRRAGEGRLLLSQRGGGPSDAGGGRARHDHGRPCLRRGLAPGVAGSRNGRRRLHDDRRRGCG